MYRIRVCGNPCTGNNRKGSIIPFASGNLVTLTTVSGGLAGTQALIGFGANGIAALVGDTIDITGLSDVSFSMPRDGILTSVAAYFSVGADVSLVGSTVTITAQLYSSPTPDDVFSPVPGAIVTLSPPLTGAVSVGDNLSGISIELSRYLTAGTRLLMVFSAEVTDGNDIDTIINGYASAGISIAETIRKYR